MRLFLSRQPQLPVSYNCFMRLLTTTPTKKIEVLGSIPYFQGLDVEELEILAQEMSLRQYSPGETILWHGEPCSGLCSVHRGSVKLFRLSARGRELVIRIFGPGATFNEVPVFDGGPNVVNVAALEESEIWVIDPTVIQKLLHSDPAMADAVIQTLAQNLRHMIELIEELSFYQVTHRLARLLSQVPPEALDGQGVGRLTQDQLAARLGTVREVVARSLRELERSGAIQVKRRQIQVINKELLEDWAQGPYHST
jgi:CRP/FNR family transcriptional regulator